ncbi:MAG: spore coat associated protein CotJA [Clostridia bacterium]|nr:spore coat associated protein CotJA [Clostridia bacterium]
MAKIVFQSWQKIYPCEKAIVRGTLFGELDLPFEARRSCR